MTRQNGGFNGETLTLVATDKHRLAVRRISQKGLGNNITAVVPGSALEAIKGFPLPAADLNSYFCAIMPMELA